MKINKILIILLVMLSFSAHAAKKAPDFSLKTTKGKISLSELKGKVVYVDFWATWCGPCRKSFPWMNEMRKKYRKQGLRIVAISLDSEKANVAKFLKKIPANFTIAYDPDGKVADKYKVEVMPSSYLIDRKGRIVETHLGFRDKDKQSLEDVIKKHL